MTDGHAAIASSVFAHAAPLGVGGLGHHAGHVLRALREHVGRLRHFGPGAPGGAPVDGADVSPAAFCGPWRRQYTWLRYLSGRYEHLSDVGFGRWLAVELERRPCARGYFFSQIARESLALTRQGGGVTILDSPTGHVRDFREQLCRESTRWTGWRYLGPPTEAMVQRVEDEYRLADWIRVSSAWAKRSLVARGVDERKVFVVPQPVDLERFRPGPRAAAVGPIRLVFVGSLTLGKGFPYLLQAMTRLGGHRFTLEMVGATGDPWCRRLLGRLSRGMSVSHGPGDPAGAYARGELLVLPTLHDGFGLVAAEAMASGLPVVTTQACGAAEWLSDGESGWVVDEGDPDAITNALDRALTERQRLGDMGRAARAAAEHLSEAAVRGQLRRCLDERWTRARASAAVA